MVAAIYVVLTVCLTPISYGGIQFRVAEILMLLCLYKKDYAISLIVGCAVANAFSPYGIIDVLVGTSATIIACLLMILVKKIYIAWLFPAITNGILVGLEITLIDELKPFFSSYGLMMLYVALGEAAVLLVGVFIFKILEKNEGFMEIIKR